MLLHASRNLSPRISDEEGRAYLHPGPCGTAPVSWSVVRDWKTVLQSADAQEAEFRGGDVNRLFSSDRSRTGLKSLTAFHGLTNAFGSVNWEAMDRAVASLQGPNALIGQQRYRLTTTTIPERDGDITLRAG